LKNWHTACFLKGMKKLFFTLFLASNAYSMCVPSELVKRLDCQTEPKAQSQCLKDYGSNYISVVEEKNCNPKGVSLEIKKYSTKTLFGRIKSQADEIDAILTMVDRKGIKGDIFNFKVPEVKTFQESHIKALLEKMEELRENIYLHGASIYAIDSYSGKESIIYAARYYSFMARIHQVMASAAHSQSFHQLSYDQLKAFTLKVDKRIGLEILARMNLKARHLDSETLSFAISEEEKQNYEFNTLQSPSKLPEYAKLVQFMGIREFLSNRWAMERISQSGMSNPKVPYCGPGMLSFRPGPDQTMANSSVSLELETFDSYFNRYPQLIDPMVAESMKVSILTASEADHLVKVVFNSLPTFTGRLINEYGWMEDEVSSWRNDISPTLKTNEDKEWEAFAKPTLSVSIFPGDSLSPANIEARVSEDIFTIRKEAIITQMDFMMDDLTAAEKRKMRAVVSAYVDGKREKFHKAIQPLIRQHVKHLSNMAAFRSKNYQEKVDQTLEIVESSLTSAFITDYIISKGLKTKLHLNKLPVNDLELKNPSEVVEFFQAKISDKSSLRYLMDSHSSHRKIVADFFEKVAKRFAALPPTLKVRDYQLALYKIAREEGQALFAQYPMPNASEQLRLDMQARQVVAADNTQVAGRQFLQVPVPGQEMPKQDSPNKTSSKKNASDESSYKVLSLARLHPAVADNTRVAINKTILEHKEMKPEIKSQFINIPEVNRLTPMKEFVTAFLALLNIDRAGKSKSFIQTLGDQDIIANIRLGAAYSSSPILRIPLTRSTTNSYFVGVDGASVSEEVKKEKPAMIRMLKALAINGDGVHSVNKQTLLNLIKETLSVAKQNQEGKTEVLCLADHKKPGSDKNFKDLFRSSTMIRMGILSNEALTQETSTRLNRLDEELKKETRYWHESINEDYIEPMMNVACVIFLVSVFIIPMLGSAGVLAPGSVMLLMTLLDGVDLAFTGASLYYRSMSTFYEVPAQVKFQKSMAMSQIANFSLTSWDDVQSAESASRSSQLLSAVFTPFDLIVGGQFYYSSKKLLGITGKNALKQLGMPARGFGSVPKHVLPRLSLSEMIKQKGVVKGTVSKGVQQVKDLKLLVPRYQPLTTTQLTDAVRVGLVTKARQLGVASKPWELTASLKSVSSKLAERLEVNKVVSDITNSSLEKASMTGKMTFKEFINKPTYAKELLVPMGLIGAMKKGQLGRYLSDWGSVMESINRLRGQMLNKRRRTLEGMVAKLAEVEQLASSRPDFLTQSKKADWMDYFQSLLSDEEIHVLSTISKTTDDPTMKAFKTVFKAHEDVIEGIVSFSTVEGRSLPKIGKAYGQEMASSEREDLKELYLDMVEKDGASHLHDENILEQRKNIEDQIL
jgi:hypothetical protein